jgi:HAD superfamily hydrolase (TIGR01509 family)
MFSKEIQNFIQQNNYPNFSPKAIFFDMDGVLFDSMKHHASAWVDALHKVGLPFTEYEAYMNEGRTGSSTIDGVFIKTYGRIATDEEKHTIYSIKSKLFEASGKTGQIAFALELLQKVKAQNLQIFVVTGSGQASLIDNLEHNFPQIFQKEKMVTAYDVQHGKPHPEPYLMALKKSGVQPWEVVVVENAPLGVESATEAGLFTIGVNTGPLNPKVLLDSGANIVLAGMEELYDRWNAFSENWY